MVSPRQNLLPLAICFGLAVVVSDSALAQTLFSENWDDGQASVRWSAPIELKENAGINFDGNANYAFDYGLLGIPSAPNSVSSTTTGLFLEANTSEQTAADEGESIGVLPLGFPLPTTDYAIRADLYLFNNQDLGSTEYATLGTHHQGTNNLPHRFSLNSGDGLAWQFDSDGLSVTDLFRYESVVGLSSSENSLGGWEDIPNGSISNVPTGDATNLGIQNQWVEIEISSIAGIIEFSINGFVIDSYDNTAEDFDAGTLLLAHSDPFNSVSLDNAAGFSNGSIFDNVIVTAISDSLAGDYNQDSVVDAADYTLWRDSFGASVSIGTGADGNGDGIIDSGDYAVWLNHYGESIPKSTSFSQSVPEPTGLLLMISLSSLLTLRLR